VGCDYSTDQFRIRERIPAISLAGNYTATYTIYIDGEEAFSSTECRLHLGNDSESIYLNGFDFALRWNGETNIIPESGVLEWIRSSNYIKLPVKGKPYDANLKSTFDQRYGFLRS